MRYFYAISALRDKRARIAGEIEAIERNAAKLRQDLATIDATLRLFHPEADPSHITSIRPKWRGVYFKKDVGYKELIRRLHEHGIEETESSITSKLARGTFAVSFFLAVLTVLELTGVDLSDL